MMKDTRNCSIIPHLHWDPEWYLTKEYFQHWLPEFFSKLIPFCKQRKHIFFVFDGATIIIHSWIDEMKRQNKVDRDAVRQFRRLVKKGQICVGPYYVQLDWYLAGEEALVRNMLFGKRDAEMFGNCMRIGWLMDNFGLPSQVPQIHAQFGINTLFIWRGINAQKKQCELRWIGEKGDEMLVIHMLDSYRNAMRLSSGDIASRIQALYYSLLPFSKSKEILLMNGYDHDLEVEDVSAFIGDGPDFNVQYSNPEAYAGIVRRGLQEHNEIPDAVTGEQICGWNVSVFPGTHSTRVHQKQNAANCEYLLHRIAEPLATLAWIHNQGSAAYPSGKITKAWQQLLRVYPHDSIAGVCIDPVHASIDKQLHSLKKKIQRLIQQSVQDLAGTKGLYFFNPSPFERTDLIAVPGKYIREHLPKKRTPRYQYMPLTLPPLTLVPLHAAVQLYQEKEAKEQFSLFLDKKNNRVRNNFWEVAISYDGTIDVYDLASKRQYRTLHILEDSADMGDCYNYSPGRDGTVCSSYGKHAEIKYITTGPCLVCIQIQHVLYLPGNSGEIAVPVVTTIMMEKRSPLLRFETVVRNRANNHRLSVRFRTGVNCEYHYASTIFNVERRNNGPRTVAESEQSALSVTARETEDYGDYPFSGWVSLGDAAGGLLLAAKGLHEYQSSKDGDLVLHLFRSVQWIARSDLQSRSGDAGPGIMVPDAQMLRDMCFEYAICPFSATWEERVQDIDIYLNPVQSIFIQDTEKELSPTGRPEDKQNSPGEASGITLLRMESADPVRFSACKCSENGKAVLLRVYNPCDRQVQARFITEFEIQHAHTVTMGEEQKEALPCSTNTLSILLAPKEVVSITLQPRLQRTVEGTERRAVGKAHAIFPSYFRKGNITKFDIPAACTDKDLREEEQRLLETERKLDAIRNSVKSGHSGKESSILHQEYTFLERELLEKRLSILLLRNRLEGNSNTDLSAIDLELQEIAAKLNKARITKRIADFQVLLGIQQ